jgi:hypothetical protein
MDGTIGFGIADDDAASENQDVFGVAHLVVLPVGKPHHERLERTSA